MSEIKTKKNFEYKKIGSGQFDGHNFGKANKNANGRRDDADKLRTQVDDMIGYNTQKTTDDSDYEQRAVNSLLHVIFKICELSGYWVNERIVLKNRKTGKIWR